MAYTYDTWHRLSAWSYAGASESYTYDALDRIATVTNPLGTFAQTYIGAGQRVAAMAYPLAGLSTTYAYFPANQDFRLSQIQHEVPGAISLAQYGYTYTPNGDITTWSQTQSGLSTGRQWNMQYDADQQLSAVMETPLTGPPSNPQPVWRHQYDASGNRTVYQKPGSTRTAQFNARNQLTGLNGGGATWFRGQVNEAAQVTLNGKAAKVSADGSFETMLNLGAGTHQVTLQATDQAANSTTETWQVDNGAANTRTVTYDVDGNTLSDGERTYTWDGRNRLTGITKNTDTWSLAYNGANLRVSENKNSVLQRQWVWHGTSLVEERLADGSKRRYWSNGVEELNAAGAQTGKHYLLKDHLGSVRVVLDGAGTLVASYSYNPWGERTKISGSGDLAIGYTGHWQHESVLVLAPYRAYDPDLGRWISEDPIAEQGGLNLYGYVNNGPTSHWDPLGFEVEGTYSISTGQLSFRDLNPKKSSFSSTCSSGTNKAKDASTPDTGPTPPGEYRIYKAPDHKQIMGQATYILDPIDGTEGNDKYDGQYNNRYGFRMHLEWPEDPKNMKGSRGCIVMPQSPLDLLKKLLDNTKKGKSRSMISPDDKNPGQHENYGKLKSLGTLKVTP